MIKIGSAQASAVAARGAATLRAVTNKCASLEIENAQLRDKVASMEREQEIEALATQMEEKGLNAGLTMDEKIAHIRRHDDLSKLAAAVDMASTGNIRIAKVAEAPGRGSLDALTSFCLGGE